MSKICKIRGLCRYALAVAISNHILATGALAAESTWRAMYDPIMMCLNFGILAFLLVKYGKTPILNFLQGKKEELAREIDRIEEEKEKILNKIKETNKEIDESDVYFAKMKERIVKEGEKKKQKIIQEAQEQSRIMLETTKRKIDNQIVQARNMFKSELVDAAIALAMEKLPKVITPKDNQKLVDYYLASAAHL